MKTPEKKTEVDPKQNPARIPGPKTREERGAEPAIPDIDFAKLDLRVEVVDERISPGETNVFDK
ncbi:MAG: hypothetical protein NTY35_13575 [Planctomycetota bacterium]|nr:hypothetical protein [Planctomycetota bacterium]